MVTWNGRGFDLPVLALRAFRFGLDFRWYYRGEGYRYRFSEEGHLDLCDVISDHGAAKMTSLDGAARPSGCPGRTASTAARSRGFSRRAARSLRRYCLVATWRRRRSCSALPAGHRRSRPRRLPPSGRRMLAALETDGRFGRLLEGVDRRRLLLSD